MIANMAAIRKAENEMRNMNLKAQNYYRIISDGSWVESYDDKVIVKYGTGESIEYSNISELSKAFAEMYDQLTVEILVDEIDRINHKQAELIVELYNDIYGDEWLEIAKDYEYGYLTINIGRDGFEYAWHYDEIISKAINLVTGEIIDNEKIDDILK